MVQYYLIFFFHDTATTEIYTYAHTLSLHDALPISPGSPVESFTLEISPAPPSGVTQKTATGNSLVWDGLENGTAYQVRVQAHNRAPEPSSWSGRSEEHTSELQSLMRISYAVFCLKKKTTATIVHSCPSRPAD